ncbi:EAL domain-containing protein [Marinobacterium marinum]|uniref:EAL domain-containing protein n=1 Tax=Marinobacterium marinum TaxID=2756129 RepID=A0A7W1WYS6_9GAMM|nr:EAL domain-containing protein [Marinobacterium marinum]MBA4502639.1 EAL domain-containing protein [Marinobacterium marinum]
MTPIRNTLNSKHLVLVSAILLAVFAWTVLWIYTRVTLDTTEQALAGQLQQQTRNHFNIALQNLNDRAHEIESLAHLISTTPNTESQQRKLTLALNWTPGLAGAALYHSWPPRQADLVLYSQNHQAQIATATDTALSFPWQHRLPHSWNNPNQIAPWWSPAYRHPINRERIITLAYPLTSSQGHPIGLLSLDWKVTDILQHITAAEATPGTLIWLTDSRNLQLSPDYQDRRQYYAQSLMEQAQAQIPLNAFLTDDEHHFLDYPEQPTELYYAPSRSGLQLVAAFPRAELDTPLANLRAQSQSYLYILGSVILGLTVIGLTLVIPIFRNLRLFDQDKLTGLPNRVSLLQDLDKNSSVSLILVNLDRFREINSLFGYECGNQVLKEVALRLETFMSEPENRGGKLYRVSGDEFALALSRRRPEQVQAQMDQILSCVRQTPVYWHNHEIGLSVTLGAAVPWFDAPKEYSLYIHAREALREARQSGLHCRVYDGSEALEQEFEHNQKWAGKLRDALDDEGLIAWFQPILNNTTGHVDKYECLVRMVDQNGQIISPGKFLDIAGKMRLEGHITRVMIDTCFQRFAHSSLEFSINLSYTDLQQPDLTAFILQRLDATGVGPRVIFELLESANIENYEQVRAFIDDVKQRGCRIAIDDFGTGYSNFEHLLQLKVDFIKIDGSLIRNLDTDPNSRRVTRGIVGLARSMKIETVAEYVHSTAVQMEVLRLGISFSQGELIGMPAPEPQMLASEEFARLSYSGRSKAKNVAPV